MSSATLAVLTPDDLIAMPRPENGKHYELSAGELIIVGNAGARHERLKSVIHELLVIWRAKFRGGRVFSETQFTLAPRTARIPDVAYVSAERLRGMPDADVAIAFAPNLAIEVISHSESADDAETKVIQYLSAGVEEVWQVYPREQRLRIRRVNEIRDLTGDQVLTSPVLPGFESPVSAFFSF